MPDISGDLCMLLFRSLYPRMSRQNWTFQTIDKLIECAFVHHLSAPLCWGFMAEIASKTEF